MTFSHPLLPVPSTSFCSHLSKLSSNQACPGRPSQTLQINPSLYHSKNPQREGGCGWMERGRKWGRKNEFKKSPLWLLGGLIMDLWAGHIKCSTWLYSILSSFLILFMCNCAVSTVESKSPNAVRCDPTTVQEWHWQEGRTCIGRQLGWVGRGHRTEGAECQLSPRIEWRVLMLACVQACQAVNGYSIDAYS